METLLPPRQPTEGRVRPGTLTLLGLGCSTCGSRTAFVGLGSWLPERYADASTLAGFACEFRHPPPRPRDQPGDHT